MDNTLPASLAEPARNVPVAAQADVVVVGGGPAGMAAAFAAARNGASTILLERYNHLGGLASGGMVLVLDDMWDAQLQEISVRGVCLDLIERLSARGLAQFPTQDDWGSNADAIRRWTRWGAFDFHTHSTPHPIVLRRRLRPRRLETHLALDMVQDSTASSCACIPGSRTRMVEGRPRDGRGVREQERAPGHPGHAW